MKELWVALSAHELGSRFNHRATKGFLWSNGFSEDLPYRSLTRCSHEQDEATAFVASLRACAKVKDLCRGTHLHDDILRRGLLHKCSDSIVIMYARCGVLVNAQELFDRHNTKNVYTWNALIAAFVNNGQGHDALIYFERMQRLLLSPDAATFTCILKACGSIGASDKGAQIHEEISKRGLLGNNLVLGNALISMYAKCGVLSKAQQVLEELPVRDVISWNALITGYVQHGKAEKALHCFNQMQYEGVAPDVVTFICILKACGSMKAADKGKKVHEDISQQGMLCNHIVLQNALVDMYAKCGALAKASEVLLELQVRDVISWSALIAGYAQQGDGEQALTYFDQMKGEGVCPNVATYIGILQACGTTGALYRGKEIHDEIVSKGLLKDDPALGNALVDMYAKCGALRKARKVFDELPIKDVISWTALIDGYVQHDECRQALDCLEQMQREGVCPNAVTFICILKACASIRATDKGEKIHEEIAKQGILRSDAVLGNALVDMYAKCGAFSKARRVLDELPVRDVFAWSALIEGYAQHNEGEQAMICFEQMQHEGIRPNVVTFISILKACAHVGAADRGEIIHDEIAKQGLLGTDVVLDTALVDMYAKCGSLPKAQNFLKELPARDAISWNSLISASIQEGKSKYGLSCFMQMQHDGVSPDAATFSCVLNACSHLGLVEDGRDYFETISRKYGMKPNLEHYSCIVDLFARAGYLKEAAGVVEKLPLVGGGAWSALLAACGKWGDVNVGRWAFDHALQVDKTDPAFYILMANVYAASHMQKDVENIESEDSVPVIATAVN